MVDFASVRPHRGSQNNAFEELVVQLARRRPPPDAREFRRIEGAGGDAGVEALWLKSGGSATGIQAKYFLRVRDIDWNQIDKSVATTLRHRPEVDVYQIALACDLTDRRGAKGRGKTGWAAWEERVKRWEADALTLGRTVSFEPITASDLVDWLGQPSAAGLARYWFGTDVLGLPWFARHTRTASADLGDRYTPSCHVVVDASLAFDGLARTENLRARLLRAVEATWKHRVLLVSTTVPDDVRATAGRADNALRRVHEIADAVEPLAPTPWDVAQWVSDTRAAEILLGRLNEELSKHACSVPGSSAKSQSDPDQLESWKHCIRKTEEALGDLERLLMSVAFRADASRVLLITGEAGTGKSHLLAAEAIRANEEERPALLFLGQQFAQGNPWDQCERSIGLPGWPRDELFGALDAAGEAAGSRTLILVDAVNEGAGASLWRNHLAGFIESLAPYLHIAVGIACRTEYVPFAIPKSVLTGYPQITLRGFAMFKEQEAAAIQYLDHREIVRPAGPLLAPEFSHPLFLKAASDALLQKRAFVFPRGLRGALKILGFYLDSVGCNLLLASAEPVDLSTELRCALQRLAEEMARTKLDHVPRSKAALIVARTFAPRTPPSGITWLDVLLRNGILRIDPNPAAHSDRFLAAPEDVTRIAFQRFQDHLVVQAALAGVTDASSLFTEGGPLEWLVSTPKRYSWTGLFEALSIQVPEVFGVELVDVLPGGAGRWWREWGVQEGFAQSVRWRAVTSAAGNATFTKRSLELLNSIDHMGAAVQGLLLEVAANTEHPWNADFLHQNLWRLGLNQRDVRWSREMAFAAEDEEHPVHRLLNWSIRGKLDNAEPEVIRLVAITLSWLCSSTSRYLRDASTRGLCRLIRREPAIHHDLLTAMAEVDDLYVLERLLAAAYGAACQLGDDPVLETMAATTFDQCFSKGAPPQHLLARDYALGVLEVAQARGRLPASVDMAKASPPFPAKPIRVPSPATLEKRKDKLGDHSIFFSCSEYGDFGRYEIAPAVRRFSATTLNSPPPLSPRNRFDLFVAEVATIDLERKTAFERLQKASREVWSFRSDSLADHIRITRTRSEAAAQEAAECEDAFLALLTSVERDRYTSDAYKVLFSEHGDREPPAFDERRAQRWVTARAYSLGWTEESFGDDQTSFYPGRQRARIERVGKKYQWIALHELLAWLTDTHWLKGDWGAQPKKYSYPTDAGNQRDLDPTLAEDTDMQASRGSDWWKTDFNLKLISDNQLKTWAMENDPWHSGENAVFRKDTANQEWVTLDSFQRVLERFTDREFVRREFNFRREVFQIVHCLLVARKALWPTFDALVAARDRGTDSWKPLNLTNGPYLGEYGWRATWPSHQLAPDDFLPGRVAVLRPVVEYSWEGHLDASRPDGLELRLPSQKLLALLNLVPPSPLSPEVTVDHAGKPLILHLKGDNGGHSVAMRRDTLKRLLIEHDLGCLWFVSAERSAWPTGGRAESTRRWFGSLIAFDGGKARSFDWETPW